MVQISQSFMNMNETFDDSISESSSSSTTTTMEPDCDNVGGKFADDAPLRVLFLSADTGGGHRASAESLAKQFQIHFPGSTYDLLDIWSEDGCFPYKSHVEQYKFLSANPSHWRLLYHTTNSPLTVYLGHRHSTYFCEAKIRNRLLSYDPDVIVSVHPTMVFTPIVCLKNIARDHGKRIPFFTVCTDLGGAHATWFNKHVEKLFVASERLYRLAKQRSGISDSKLVLAGLPIRHDFAVQAQQLGNRTQPSGRAYQREIRQKLNLIPQETTSSKPPFSNNKHMVLLMGGGEGVGSLETITTAIYKTFYKRNIDATICVCCGRNGALREQLATMDWNAVAKNEKQNEEQSGEGSEVFYNAASTMLDVVPLGFLTNMAEYMVATDVLISKAGPGSIAEAASLGLPVLLTSYLPGQEAGNVDFVLENGFGAYENDPESIASTVATWLENPDTYSTLSAKARDAGKPDAAGEIVLEIGTTTHRRNRLEKENEKLMNLASKQAALTETTSCVTERQCGVSLLDYWGNSTYFSGYFNTTRQTSFEGFEVNDQ